MADPTKYLPLNDLDGNGRISPSEFSFWAGQVQAKWDLLKSYEVGGSRAGKYSFSNDYNQDGRTNTQDFIFRFGSDATHAVSSVKSRLAMADPTLYTTAPSSPVSSSSFSSFYVAVAGFGVAIISIALLLFVIRVSRTAVSKVG